ncbi:hypothetical protein OBBRIDRAFT_167821 [Obba rivulosa]|uniref:Transmembrane protein n=1 Tax=Obba rivulosa TaxID=1052685 RepID=A0A8E2AQ53_9APHY|nr:hypothetical protein OBBRIDRAFT_167821 [Obba rivulosa]
MSRESLHLSLSRTTPFLSSQPFWYSAEQPSTVLHSSRVTSRTQLRDAMSPLPSTASNVPRSDASSKASGLVTLPVATVMGIFLVFFILVLGTLYSVSRKRDSVTLLHSHHTAPRLHRPVGRTSMHSLHETLIPAAVPEYAPSAIEHHTSISHTSVERCAHPHPLIPAVPVANPSLVTRPPPAYLAPSKSELFKASVENLNWH